MVVRWRPQVLDAEALNAEFMKKGAFTLSYSTDPALFWSGLSRLTGPPTVQTVQANLLSMKEEHMNGADSHVPFYVRPAATDGRSAPRVHALACTLSRARA